MDNIIEYIVNLIIQKCVTPLINWLLEKSKDLIAKWINWLITESKSMINKYQYKYPSTYQYPNIKEAIVRMVHLYQGPVPKAMVMSALIRVGVISSNEQNILQKVMDNEIDNLVAEGRMHVENINTIPMLVPV